MVSLLTLAQGRSWQAIAVAAVLAVGSSSALSFMQPFAGSAQAATVSVQINEQLSRYGTWGRSARYGEVWVPSVATNWRPYTLGRWVWTDDGWYWESEEPFGDVVFHYGRWAYDPDLGWVWIADDEWAPAWVVWRQGDDEIGWVPAPPDDDVVVEDVWWTFVPVAAFGAPRLVSVIRPIEFNQVLVRNTTIINRKVVINEYGDAGRVRIGKETIPVDAGPAIGKLPSTVVAKVRAAGIVPPPHGARFASARLDPSKAAAVKKGAAKLAPPTSPVSRRGQVARTSPKADMTSQVGKSAAIVPRNMRKQRLAVPHPTPNAAIRMTRKSTPPRVQIVEKKKPERVAGQGRFAKAPVIMQRKSAGQSRVATMGQAPSPRVIMTRRTPDKHVHRMARISDRKAGQPSPAQRLKCDPHDPRCRRRM